jgi:hypothetical protein
LRRKRAVSAPAARLVKALVRPKAMMKEKTARSLVRPKVSEPMSGTVVRSRPTRPPTQMLTMTSRVN